ncbi:MAG: hypothetical protein H6694_06995 [Candidatus Latescibacteria bacterium]|nr:hypothetical protein [Candidatus Latescibacterota bacterium]
MTRLPAVPILLALASSASAATLQVPADFPAIAGALAVASSGDTVLVSPGTYLEHDLVLPSGVVLLGDAATPEHVVIDAAGQGRVLFGDGLAAGTEIGMLTLQGGATSETGGGAYLAGSFLLRDCVIRDCRAISGGGAVVEASGDGVTVERALFEDNEATASYRHGGGLDARADSYHTPLLILGSRFVGNTAAGEGGGLWLVDGGVERCLFLRNSAGGAGGMALPGGFDHVDECVFVENQAAHRGGGAVSFAFVELTRCTFVLNRAEYGAAVYYLGDSGVEALTHLDRCIIAFNEAGPSGSAVNGWYDPWEGPRYRANCCVVYGNTPGDGDATYPSADNIIADPQFCPGAGEGRYPIADGSPCAPANSPCGERIGAFDPACASTAVERRSWGAVKSLY